MQSTAASAETYETLDMHDAKERVAPLNEFWAENDASAHKAKLLVAWRFNLTDEPPAAAGAAAPIPSLATAKDEVKRSLARSGAPAEGADGESVLEQLRKTQKTCAGRSLPAAADAEPNDLGSSPPPRDARSYDELVAFTVNLTAERDALRADLERTRAEKSSAKVRARRPPRGRAAAPRSEPRALRSRAGQTQREGGRTARRERGGARDWIHAPRARGHVRDVRAARIAHGRPLTRRARAECRAAAAGGDSPGARRPNCYIQPVLASCPCTSRESLRPVLEQFAFELILDHFDAFAKIFVEAHRAREPPHRRAVSSCRPSASRSSPQ